MADDTVVSGTISVATPMMACATGKQIVIHARPGPVVGAGTFCRISWIHVVG